jgi:hypothetical protein
MRLTLIGQLRDCKAPFSQHKSANPLKVRRQRPEAWLVPLYDFYAALFTKEMNPGMARLTLARKMAANRYNSSPCKWQPSQADVIK